MKKFIVETYYTCTFKTVHSLNELNDLELSKIDNRKDGEVEVIDVRLNNRKTKKIGDKNNKEDQKTNKSNEISELIASKVKWEDGKMMEIPGSEFKLKADLVLLAMGFISPQQKILDLFNVEKDQRGNAKADTEGESSYATSKNKVFAAGDMRRGQSLVVWAIREGRQCARSVDEFLMGKTTLPR